MSKQWRSEDITPVDPIEYARSHPDQLLGRGYTASNELLLDRLLSGVWTLRPAARPRTEVRGSWGYLVCDVDWLAEPHPRDPFKEIVPFPESGLNGFRPEVLITAFSAVAATLTALPDDIEMLTGDEAELDPSAVAHARSLLGPEGRAVLLRA